MSVDVDQGPLLEAGLPPAMISLVMVLHQDQRSIMPKA